MKKLYFIILIGIFGIFPAMAQSYAVFHERPKMQLNPQNEYKHCKIRYKAQQKSTIYLELKKGNEIVASGVYDVTRPSEEVVQIPLKTKKIQKLTPSQNYSYNLYMYAGGRNDWTKKSCRSTHINKVQMRSAPKLKKNESMSTSFRSFFK